MIMIRTGGSQRIEHVQVPIVSGRQKFLTFFIFFLLCTRRSLFECRLMIILDSRWAEGCAGVKQSP